MFPRQDAMAVRMPCAMTPCDRFPVEPRTRATLWTERSGRRAAQWDGMKQSKPSNPAPENETTESGATQTVRVATLAVRARLDMQLAASRYLGAGRSIGGYLWQIVNGRDRVTELLVRGRVCDALKDQDRWIGCSANQRVERLKLVVQNRRFPVLGGKSPQAQPSVSGDRRGLARAARAVAGKLWLPATVRRELHRPVGVCGQRPAWSPRRRPSRSTIRRKARSVASNPPRRRCRAARQRWITSSSPPVRRTAEKRPPGSSPKTAALPAPD